MALGLRLRARHHYVKGRAKSVARSKKTDGTVPNGLGGLWMGGVQSGYQRTPFVPVGQVCFGAQWVLGRWRNGSDMPTVSITVFIGLISPRLPLI